MREAIDRPDSEHHVALGPADWLALAAAPTFAAMALQTGVVGGDGMAVVCGVARAPLGGMVPMYLLMAAFHLAPWLRLIARRRPATLQS